ncbi:MAG: hypothetical protein DWQ37_12615 [Planctomycetota bacterium]|nr:MAG: hypothetical protein DWQ37_12615 [Planctomycetota bacterium]
MDESTFRELLRKDKGVHGGKLNVLVVTKEMPSTGALQELESFGLQVGEVAGNKIVGTIDESKVEQLRHHALIAEVELSSRMKPHA